METSDHEAHLCTAVKSGLEESRRVDSGMDEGSNSSQELGDNSEDEEIVSLKPKKTVHRIFDDESEDSRDVAEPESSRSQSKEFKTAEEVLDEVLNASSSDESDGDNVTLAASLKKKKVQRPTVSEDSSDDDGTTLLSAIKNNAKSAMSDIFDAEEDSDSKESPEDSSQGNSQPTSSIDKEEEMKTKEKEERRKKKKKREKVSSPRKKASETKFGTGDNFKSKEFIADSSDSDDDDDKPVKPSLPDDFFDDEKKDSSGSDSDQSGSQHSEGDEGFDESTISPALLAKLKKGAGKKEKPARKARRVAEEARMQIHSESQRMVRESRVSIPYHQPAPRSINDFLARASKKQQEYKVLKGARDSTKAKLLQDVLQKTKLPAPTLTEKDNDSDEDWNPEDDHMKALKDRLDERLKGKNETGDSTALNGSEINRLENGIEKEKPENDKAMSQDVMKDDGTVSDTDSLPDIGQENIQIESDKLTLVQGSSELVSNVDSAKQTDINETDTSDMQVDEIVDNMANGSDENNQSKLDCSKAHNNTFDTKEGEKETVIAENSSSEKGSLAEPENKTEDHCTEKNELSQDEQNSAENDENKDPNVPLNEISVQNEKLANKTETEDLTVSDKKKKNKFDVLAAIDLTNVKPCLSGNRDTFICLEEGEPAPAHPEVAKLMDRLCKHSTKKEKKHATDLDISIIQKDKTGLDKEELKLNTFTYHTEEEIENPLMKLETPGAKFMALREQLQAKMKEKREQARKERQEIYDLDNEEGGFEVEEEEAEMSDRSDTDVEEEDGLDNEDELEDDGLEEDDQAETNPFADDEAAEDGDGDENDADISDDDDEMNLKLDLSDEDSETEEQPPSPVLTSKKKRQSIDISDDNTADTDLSQHEDETAGSAFKEPAEKPPDKPFSMFGSKSKENMVPDTQLQSGQRSFSLTFPEESQDLYGNTMPELGPTQYKQTQESQKLNFFLEDSQSNMLDADGYLRVKSTAKKPVKPASLDELSETQDHMDDLLDLCSGKFTGTQQPKDKTSRKSLFEEPEVKETQGSMDELMGLCSGVFSKVSQQTSQTQGLKRKISEDDADNDSIEAFSDDERPTDDKDEFSDNDNNNDNDDEGGDEVDGGDEGNDTDDVEDGEEEEREKFTGFTVKNKHGKIRQEFVEAEAELSGSEAESDEDFDLDDDDDIMEVEEGDKDKIANNDQLRDEVGRVHLKQLIDEDKRELMRFQEMYLPDGDLHSDGNGRMRRFRWNNNDDDTQQDMFDNDSEGEAAEDETDTDFKWRKERFEREQSIKEQQEKEGDDTESSQFMKFGKIFLKKQSSVDKTMVAEKPTTAKPATSGKQSPSQNFYKLSNQKRGSFLARSKDALAKIAEMTKPVANPSAGAKSSGKFTFSVISPDKESSQQAETSAKPKRQAHTGADKNKVTASTKPPAKKQKLDSDSTFTQNSIFHHL